jgi:hypothetical protein
MPSYCTHVITVDNSARPGFVTIMVYQNGTMHSEFYLPKESARQFAQELERQTRPPLKINPVEYSHLEEHHETT